MIFDYDAIICGAGAAGLMAAIYAAERGRRVLLLEKGRKAGVKILMSGGTRCNITHDCEIRGIIDAFGPNGRFLHSALAAFSPKDILAFFHGECRFGKCELGPAAIQSAQDGIEYIDGAIADGENLAGLFDFGFHPLAVEER